MIHPEEHSGKLDVLNNFVTGYKDAVHTSNGIAPSQVTDKDLLHIREKMTKRQAVIRRASPIYPMGER